LKRYKIFSKNLDGIELHNKQFKANGTTYEQGMTEFGDLTNTEFIQKHTGLKVEPEKSHRRVKRAETTPLIVPSNWTSGNLDLRTDAIPV
jgi:hypothetical protein